MTKWRSLVAPPNSCPLPYQLKFKILKNKNIMLLQIILAVFGLSTTVIAGQELCHSEEEH